MISKQAVLMEIPIRMRCEKVTSWKEFDDLRRVIESQKVTDADLELIKKEIIARRDRMGLHFGMNKKGHGLW